MTESVSHSDVPQSDDCMAKVLPALDEQKKTLPTYRCGLVNWRSTCNLLGILQSKDVSDLCSLQKMSNPFAIHVGSSDTLAGSGRVAKCGEMDSTQVAVSETLVTQMYLEAETL